MARFRLTTAHVFGSRKLKAGSTIVDSVANAVGNDVVITTLSSTTCSNGMVAIDAAGSAMLSGSRFASGPSNTFIDGVNSID